MIAIMSIICFFGYGATLSSIGLFLEPIRAELELSMGRVSLVGSGFMAAGCAASVGTGWLIDRYGARRLIAVGAFLSGAGLVLAAQAHGIALVFTGFFLAGIGMTASTYVPCMALLSRRVDEGLGVAVGIILAAAAAGSALIPMLLVNLVPLYGWRSILVGTGLAVIAFSVPAALALKNGPRIPADTSSDGRIVSARQMRSSRLFRPNLMRIYLLQFVFTVGYMGLYLHLMPLLEERGFAPAAVGALFGAMNLISALGLLATGWAADRFGARNILLLSLALNGGSIFLLLGTTPLPSSAIIISLFIAIWGATQGAVTQLSPLLLAQAAQAEDIGTASGIMGIAQGSAGAVGPLLIGTLHDITNGYRVGIIVAGSLAFVSILCLANAQVRRRALD